jgi:hypothetical protein
MNVERNPYAVSQTAVKTPDVSSFGMTLTLALVLPVLIAIGAGLTQWLFKFPPRSAGASLTAIGLVVAFVAEIFPVPIAVTKLVRNPALRSRRNVTLTALAALLLLPGIAIFVALIVGASR